MQREHDMRGAMFLAVVLCVSAGACNRESACERDARASAWKAALSSCAAASSEKDALALARARLYTGDREGAERAAHALLEGQHRADALWVLGVLAAQAQRTDEAVTHFTNAAELHRAAHADAALARDAHGLAGAWVAAGRLDRALDAQREAAAAAQRAGDKRMLVYTELAMADILRGAGDGLAAEEALSRALATADTAADRAWVKLKQGILYIDLGLPVLARAPLESAAQLERASPSPRAEILSSAALNLSWLARRTGRVSEALRLVNEAEGAGASPLHVHLNRGLALADGAQLEAAGRELAAAEALNPTGQWSWWVPFNAGLVAERLGELAAAEAAYGRAIAAVEELDRHAGALGPQLAATHREPFLRLIGLEARRERWNEVLGVLVRLDAGALLSSQEPASELSLHGLPRGAAASEVARAPVEAGEVARVLAAWRSRRLAIVLPGGESLWRLEVVGGAVRGVEVGPARKLEALAARLEADPGETATAQALGQALVPALDGGAPLELLLVGPVARAPLAALRRDGQLVVARTPLVRVLGLLPRGARPAGAAPPCVFGDPRGDLPDARAEAVAAAASLGATARLGADATPASFEREADGAAVVHLATHVEQTAAGPQVLLAGGSVGPAHIARLSHAPRLVVLASCGAAAARDDAGWGSLAAAFLSLGSRHVVASPWAVTDASAATVVKAFYAHGGAADPVPALAAAQVELSASLPAREWAGFTVLAPTPPGL